MTLIRWSPMLSSPSRDLTSIHDEVNRLFDGFLSRGGYSGERASVFAPAVDVEETPEEFVVRADLPGVAQKDVKVNLLGDTLTVRGERKQQQETKGRNYHRAERSHGVFERSFTFGAPVRNDGVRAQYRDGVLEIHVPKAEEAKVREVEVQVAS